MPQEPQVPEPFGPESFRLYAREVLRLDLADDELEPLRATVNGLIAELAPLEALALGDDDLGVSFGLDPEGWTR